MTEDRQVKRVNLEEAVGIMADQLDIFMTNVCSAPPEVAAQLAEAIAETADEARGIYPRQAEMFDALVAFIKGLHTITLH